MNLITNVLYDSLLVTVLCSGVPLVICSILGLLIGLIQTATQIQEQSVIFLVKIITIIFIVMLLGQQMLNMFVDYFVKSFQFISYID